MDTRNSTSEMMSKLYEHEAVNKSNYLSSKNFNEKEQKLASCQDNDRGDVKVHSELPAKPIIYQHPESLAAGEYQTRVNPTSAYQCSQEPQTPCVKTAKLNIIHSGTIRQV
ncbi:PREDICTED: uncharacterized protein LOC105363321 [Ceratosolen solmsi marchali]|uniref:Uncharacterized protein LOC105363321 n=1 Tax=Ceratosolen solmsi marchali TaxID=326594 RepID=A0AAJ7DWT8_9HYME|nr:PREDICTED: uncharacterized protein LOC105363321 [Ceratosolen solmsi marchali]